ncbi:MAG: hypothetical protein IK080_01705 [Clostridia bacterium]|nr:hypothetical protein [Clostridia bacterium]
MWIIILHAFCKNDAFSAKIVILLFAGQRNSGAVAPAKCFLFLQPGRAMSSERKSVRLELRPEFFTANYRAATAGVSTQTVLPVPDVDQPPDMEC